MAAQGSCSVIILDGGVQSRLDSCLFMPTRHLSLQLASLASSGNGQRGYAGLPRKDTVAQSFLATSSTPEKVLLWDSGTLNSTCFLNLLVVASP